MRTNPDGTIHTWIAKGIKSGEPVTVDDQTFDPEHHVNTDKAEIAYQKALGKAAKDEDAEIPAGDSVAVETAAPGKKGKKGKKG